MASVVLKLKATPAICLADVVLFLGFDIFYLRQRQMLQKTTRGDWNLLWGKELIFLLKEDGMKKASHFQFVTRQPVFVISEWLFVISLPTLGIVILFKFCHRDKIKNTLFLISYMYWPFAFLLLYIIS